MNRGNKEDVVVVEKEKKRSEEKIVLPGIELGTFDAPDQHFTTGPCGTHREYEWKFYY